MARADKQNQVGIRTREQLIDALALGAELEHNLCLMYLFAAFSMKTQLSQGINEIQRNAIRNWKSVILLVAKQEMEHLGLVCNMLNAIGGAQHFQRPNFPQRSTYYGTDVNMTLERFNMDTMNRFVRVEEPANLVPGTTNRFTRFDPTPYFEPDQLVPQPPDFFGHSVVQELYTAIRDGFQYLDKDKSVDLFIGPKQAQLDDNEIDVGFDNTEYGINMFKVTDLKTAVQAVDEIIEQGEGVILGRSGRVDPNSHYERFRRVRTELECALAADPDFDPALEVVKNPALNLHADNQDNSEFVTIVTDPDTREVLEVFNAGYEIMLQMLIRLFGYGDDTKHDRKVLIRNAFFPFMTMFIRPVGEILCELPAFKRNRNGPRAGPSFEFYRDVDYLPNREAAWTYLAERLDELAVAARRVQKVHPNLPYVHTSLRRIAENFRRALHVPLGSEK